MKNTTGSRTFSLGQPINVGNITDGTLSELNPPRQLSEPQSSTTAGISAAILRKKYCNGKRIAIAARLPEHRCVSYHHCSEVTWIPERLISPLQRGYLNTVASHITISVRLPEHRCVSYHHCSEVTWTPVRLISPLQWGHLNTGASQFTGNSTVCPWNSFFRPKTKKTSTPHIIGPLSRQTSSAVMRKEFPCHEWAVILLLKHHWFGFEKKKNAYELMNMRGLKFSTYV